MLCGKHLLVKLKQTEAEATGSGAASHHKFRVTKIQCNRAESPELIGPSEATQKLLGREELRLSSI